MERHVFYDSNYLLTFYFPFDGEFDCYACTSMQEVFQILTDKIKENLSYLEESEPGYISVLRDEEEDSAFIDYVDGTQCITNPEIIAKFFSDIIADDGIFYQVTSGKGNTIFSFHC